MADKTTDKDTDKTVGEEAKPAPEQKASTRPASTRAVDTEKPDGPRLIRAVPGHRIQLAPDHVIDDTGEVVPAGDVVELRRRLKSASIPFREDEAPAES